MKVKFKRLATFALAIGVNYSAFSQTSWELTGNAIGAANYLGTQNNQPLQLRTVLSQPIDFYTNSSATPRMRIASAGWVGVGSSNPSSVLHLNKANTGEMFRTVGADTSENRWRLFTNGNAVVEKFR
jgi:hypothetical protein